MEDLKIAIVHGEPCLAFVDDNETPDEICDACGWLVDEHGDTFAFTARSTPAAA
ncbi:MAG: hypothetical protein ACXW2C_07650 [Acidimicrobiia bacterium]